MAYNQSETGCRGRLSRSCNGRLRALPIWDTLKDYTLDKSKKDLRAACNVMLMDFPQSMGYAMIAGLPIQFGVYCSAIASLVGPLFASSRFVMIGPTTATSILVLGTFLSLNVGFEQMLVGLPILVMLVGLLLVTGAMLRLGGLVRYISRSVTSAYVTAVACLIMMNQLSCVLGLEVARTSTFLGMMHTTLRHMGEVHLPTCALSLLTFLTHQHLRRHFRGLPHIGATLILMALVAYVMNYAEMNIQTALAVPVGGWNWGWPSIDFEWIRQLSQPAIALALLVLLDSSNIAKSIAAQAGERVDLNQQMLSLGVANLMSSLGSGMVVSASVIRSQVNFASGAVTLMSSVFSGLMIITGLALLGPYFEYIPTASLGMLVMIVAVSLIKKDTILMIVRSTTEDAVVFGLTLVVGLLFHLESAIYVGAGLSIIFFLKKVSVPQLIEYDFDDHGKLRERLDTSKPNVPEISIVHVEGDLFFGSSDIFLDQIRLIVQDPNLKVIILRLRNAHHLDATSAMAIQELVQFARANDRDLVVSGMVQDVETVFRSSGLLKVIGQENCFADSPVNPNQSTREALKRAQEIIGQKTSKIKLFVAPPNPTSSVQTATSQADPA